MPSVITTNVVYVIEMQFHLMIILIKAIKSHFKYYVFLCSAKEVADLRTEMKGKEKRQVEELENQLLKQKDCTTAQKEQPH